MTAPPELRELDEQIAEARRDKESAIDEQDFEKAARLRDTEKQLTAKRAEKEKAWKSGDLDSVAEVDEELIAEVLALATGIPVFKLTEEESSRLLRMEDELHKRVVGQNDAIKALSQAIRRTRAGLKDPKRPGGSFIFAGPTGVGKTELAKALAEFLFGDEDALIQLDMSEFSEKHTVSRLFGSPPGYVGYDEGGQLTEKVRRRPFSVVLFDEVEKAHADIFNSLLQILEDGRLTDSQGRVVDFKNTIIIMTTNLGTRDIAKGLQTGFQAGGDLSTDYERMKSKVNDELKQHFRPEFLNRVDDVVVFPQLLAGRDHPDRRPDDRQARAATEGQGHGHRAHARGQAAARREGVRPRAGRPAAAPRDPARDRGRPVREDPVRRAASGPDRGGRRPGRGSARGVHLPRARAARRATDAGEPVGVSVSSMPPLTTTDEAPPGTTRTDPDRAAPPRTADARPRTCGAGRRRLCRIARSGRAAGRGSDQVGRRWDVSRVPSIAAASSQEPSPLRCSSRGARVGPSPEGRRPAPDPGSGAASATGSAGSPSSLTGAILTDDLSGAAQVHRWDPGDCVPSSPSGRWCDMVLATKQPGQGAPGGGAPPSVGVRGDGTVVRHASSPSCVRYGACSTLNCLLLCPGPRLRDPGLGRGALLGYGVDRPPPRGSDRAAAVDRVEASVPAA